MAARGPLVTSLALGAAMKIHGHWGRTTDVPSGPSLNGELAFDLLRRGSLTIKLSSSVASFVKGGETHISLPYWDSSSS